MGATGSPEAPPAHEQPPRRPSRAAAIIIADLPLLELAAMAVAAAVAVAWAFWQPPVRDLAGHLFRIDQYVASGPHLWNNFWYGGHLTPGYSTLFPPVAAAIGIAATGVFAATIASGCFAALIHRAAGRAASPGALWFGAATGTNLFTGRVVFAMGAALGLGACLAAQRGRAVATAVLGIAAGATSPVAATFVALAGVALLAAGDSPRTRRYGVVLAAAPALTVLVLSAAFPSRGMPSSAPSPWPRRSSPAYRCGRRRRPPTAYCAPARCSTSLAAAWRSSCRRRWAAQPAGWQRWSRGRSGSRSCSLAGERGHSQRG